MAAGKGGLFEKIRRFIRTLHFLVVMVASLLILWLPILVAIGDILVPCVLISSFTCVKCYSFKEHLQRYDFRSSLTDVPVVSAIRSLIISGVYLMYDSPVLSHGQYLGTVTLCSIFSILVLSVKACVFTVNSQLEAEASSSLSTQRLHLKKSWGMHVLFLSSVVFALGHTVIAYRTSCRARRKLMFNRINPESVRVFLNQILSSIGYAKVPRSPTPTSDRAQKSDDEIRRKPLRLGHNHGELPVRLLTDVDSLFMPWHGLTIHYKLTMPSPPSRTLSSTTLLENPSLSDIPKTQHHLRRSFSIQIQDSSLYAPLLDGNSSPIFSEEMPVFSIDEGTNEYPTSKVVSPSPQVSEVNGRFGIVLVHGFGGGVFSWRHIMAVLSRQVDMLISFCKEMGLSSVVLVGHDDGGLLALKAARRVLSSPNAVDVEIKGVVLLTVSLSREVVPGLARILMRTSLGKKHLVHSLLRTEICQAPLCVEGWDDALYEIGKLSSDTVLSEQNASLLVQEVEDTPVMVIAGAEDALVPLKSVQNMASKFTLVAISGCGHLPHEECPKVLLAAMLPFISKLL
ncbi:hypothetical protein Ccrd_023764, partial [Cynara cardunculus var. scolymus]